MGGPELIEKVQTTFAAIFMCMYYCVQCVLVHTWCVCCVQVLAGEVKGFDRCLASQELADNIKPLQRTLKALTPSTRRGELVSCVIIVCIAAFGACWRCSD